MARLLAEIPLPDPAANSWHEVAPQAMLDLETLGGHRPMVIGIGIAAFGVLRTNGGLVPWACPLYTSWPITTTGQEDRTTDRETIGWWLSQDATVRAHAANALGFGPSAYLPRLAESVRRAWQAAEAAGIGKWWAKPAAFDLWIWHELLVRNGATDPLMRSLRDARTAWEAAEAATGEVVAEPDKASLGLGDEHDPGVDALATALATADALALLRGGARKDSHTAQLVETHNWRSVATDWMGVVAAVCKQLDIGMTLDPAKDKANILAHLTDQLSAPPYTGGARPR